MAGLTFTIDTTNMTAAAMKQLKAAAPKAEHALAIQVRKDTAQFVPMLTGSLRQRTRVDGNKIIYPGPYAQYLYYGKLMVDPETGSSWAKKGSSKVLTDKDLVLAHANDPEAVPHWFDVSKSINLDKWKRVAKKAVENGL